MYMHCSMKSSHMQHLSQNKQSFLIHQIQISLDINLSIKDADYLPLRHKKRQKRQTQRQSNELSYLIQ